MRQGKIKNIKIKSWKPVLQDSQSKPLNSEGAKANKRTKKKKRQQQPN